MEKGKKILVIAPHADDEVLGCGGYLIQQSKASAEIRIVIGTIGGVDVRQDFATRLKEFNNVCTRLCAKGKFLFKDKDAVLDTIPSFEIIRELDREIDRFRPDEIFINYRSRHQDHIKIYDCSMASLRLREGYMPKFVALYEYSFISDGLELPKGGAAYHDITDVIDDKVALFNLYATQVRQSPSPLNGNGIKKLAQIRGLEIGVDYAEKFYIQKMKL